MQATLRKQIAFVHKTNPTWCALQIALRLKCSSSYVRNVAYEKGLKLPRKNYEQDRRGTIERLGEACRAAGLSLADIERISNHQPAGGLHGEEKGRDTRQRPQQSVDGRREARAHAAS